MPQRKLSGAVLIADLAWSVVAMFIAVALRYGVHTSFDRDLASQLYPFFLAACLLWALFSLILPLDGFRGGWRLSAVISHSLMAVTVLMLVMLSGGYLVRSYVSRLVLIEFCLLLFTGFVLLRIGFYLFMRAQLRNGGVQRIVIMGSGRLARELARKIERHPEMLCRVVGLLSPDDGPLDSRLSIAGANPARNTTTLGVVELLAEQKTDEVILVLDECASPDLLNLTALCRERGIRVSLVPQFYALYLSRFHLTDLDGLPVLRLNKPGPNVPALVGKRLLDLVGGVLLSLLSLPVLLPVAFILRCIKGKAYRWETRCGFQGEPFAMLRLNVDRVASNGSRFEGILREFSVTELPQLWNVLRGDMSLVGPRPESRDRVCRYSDWQQQRLTVKPGMTGLAQVQGLREQHSSEEKTRFDLQYLLNSSLWTDLSLMLQTIWTLVTRPTRRRDHIPDGPLPGTAKHLLAPPAEQDIFESAHRP